MKPKILGLLAVAMLAAGEAQTAPVATNLDLLFSLDANPNIFYSQPSDAFKFPHATVKGRIDPSTEVEWFSFTGTSGAKFFADVDNAEYRTSSTTTTALTNSLIALFNPEGQLLGFGDDGRVDPGSEGSLASAFTTLDAFFGTYTLPADGTYNSPSCPCRALRPTFKAASAAGPQHSPGQTVSPGRRI